MYHITLNTQSKFKKRRYSSLRYLIFIKNSSF